jgi:hypothetical protein
MCDLLWSDPDGVYLLKSGLKNAMSAQHVFLFFQQI